MSKKVRIKIGVYILVVIFGSWAIVSSFTALPFAEASSAFRSKRPSAAAAATPTPPQSPNPAENTSDPYWEPELNLDGMLGSSDVDCDGISNSRDNCMLTHNPKQKDKNKNGIGDLCEPRHPDEDIRFIPCDGDGDGASDLKDNCPSVCNPDQKDENQNGVGDVCDQAFTGAVFGEKPCVKRAKLKIPKRFRE